MTHKRHFILAVAVLLSLSACDRGSRPAQIGRPAPDFTVSNVDRTLSLHNYRGQVVVLNFWATWCPPCIEEMPSLMRMQDDIGGKVAILAVSTDENETAYRQFLSDRHIRLLTVRDGSQASNHAYGTIHFPETYVIDKHNVIRRKFIGPVTWTKPEIEKYLLDLAAE